MRALVTGATGFIGNHLVLELHRRGWDVVCVVRKPVQAVDINIRCVQADLLRPESLRLVDVPSGSVDALFHFAALLPSEEIPPEQYLIANCHATAQLLKSADELGIKSFVYASSLPVIGVPKYVPITEDHATNPTHPYHVSKLCGERACEMARVSQRRSICSLRITSPYGPGMANKGVLSQFVNRALKSENIQWFGSGSRAQNFVHVSDVVRAAILAAGTDRPGIYNVGGSETTTMRELAQLIVKCIPHSQSDMSSAAIADPEEGCRWEVDLSRAESCLGYRVTTSIAQGLADYVAWHQANNDARRWWKS